MAEINRLKYSATDFPIVLSASDPQIKNWLRDFREPRLGGVIRLVGEGKYIDASELALQAENTHETQEYKILAELVSTSAWKRPSLLQRWLVAARPAYLWFSLLPFFFVLTSSWRKFSAAEPTEFISLAILFFFAMLLLHIGCNLWVDADDHLHGVDTLESSGGSGVMRKLWIPAIHIRYMSIFFAIMGVALSFILLMQINWQAAGEKILALGLAAALLSAGYSGWPFRFKYYGLGEAAILLLCGPVICAVAALTLTHEIPLELWSASIAIGAMAAIRLLARNLQHLPADHLAGSRTLVTILGFQNSLRLLRLAVLMLFVLPIFLPGIARWIWLAIPLMIWIETQARKITGPLDPELPSLRKKLLVLHIFYGILLCIGAYLQLG